MKLKTSGSRRTIIVKRSRRWWTPWDHRGTIEIADLPGLHELTPQIARHLSDPHVRSSDAVARSVVGAEIRRREGRTARLALAVSIIAVAISFLALLAHI
jgi:hypothetical protein